MIKLLTILALLPISLMAQNLPTKDTPNMNFNEAHRNWYLSSPGLQHRGTLYIIDDVVVKTVELMEVALIKPLIDINSPNTLKLQRKDIMTLPYTDLTDMVSLATSAHQQQRGAANHMGGGRQEDILYVIDGMQIARR